MRYHIGMILLSVQGRGAVFTLCILFFCIVIVHIIKLSVIGWRAFHRREPKIKEKEEPQEPVYYIVEKKKSAPKYGKPKKIKFQK